jgi:hypothetical protein
MSDQLTLDFTAPRHHLVHRYGPETEREGLEKVDTAGDEKAVFWLICKAGDQGVTAKEAMRALGKTGLNCISGRFTSLQTKRMIRWSGDKREGCRVMVCTTGISRPMKPQGLGE